MKPLYWFDRDIQTRLIASHLGKYGKLIGHMEGSFGKIFTFAGIAYPTHTVAKCPKIIKFGNPDRSAEALGKVIIELQKSLEYYRYVGVHRISDVHVVQGWPFLISRMRTGTLSDLIGEPSNWTPIDRTSSIVQIAHTLNYCRLKGLLAHQDLKPDNILFDSAIERYGIDRTDYIGMVHQIFIADFGIANGFRDIGRNTGSRPYMAPEQYSREPINIGQGTKIDVFALAVIAHECFADGLHPIGEKTADVWPRRLPQKPKKWDHEDVWKAWARRKDKLANAYKTADVPAGLRDLLEASLSPDPNLRPDMSELENTLWGELRRIEPARAEGLQMQLDDFDSLAAEAAGGWPYVEGRLNDLRHLYAQRVAGQHEYS